MHNFPQSHPFSKCHISRLLCTFDFRENKQEGFKEVNSQQISTDLKKSFRELGGNELKEGEMHNLSWLHLGQKINQTAATDKHSGNQNHMLEGRYTVVLICFW